MEPKENEREDWEGRKGVRYELRRKEKTERRGRSTGEKAELGTSRRERGREREKEGERKVIGKGGMKRRMRREEEGSKIEQRRRGRQDLKENGGERQ